MAGRLSVSSYRVSIHGFRVTMVVIKGVSRVGCRQ